MRGKLGPVTREEKPSYLQLKALYCEDIKLPRYKHSRKRGIFLSGFL